MFQRLRGYYNTAICDIRYQRAEVLLWRAFVKLLKPIVRIDLHVLYDKDTALPIEQLPAKIGCTLGRAGPEGVDEIVDMQMALPPQAVQENLPDVQELMDAQVA